MKGFTEDEKIIAKNIDREYEWLARDSDGNLYVYEGKPRKDECSWYSDDYDCLFYFNHLFPAIKWEDEDPTRISDIYNPAILDDTEREYLKMVLKPFHDEVKYIIKRGNNPNGDDTYRNEYLQIALSNGFLTFPDFFMLEKCIQEWNWIRNINWTNLELHTQIERIEG